MTVAININLFPAVYTGHGCYFGRSWEIATYIIFANYTQLHAVSVIYIMVSMVITFEINKDFYLFILLWSLFIHITMTRKFLCHHIHFYKK